MNILSISEGETWRPAREETMGRKKNSDAVAALKKRSTKGVPKRRRNSDAVAALKEKNNQMWASIQGHIAQPHGIPCN